MERDQAKLIDFMRCWETEVDSVDLTDFRGPSISTVPSRLRKQDPDAYEPRLVSIGPLHRGKPSLLTMELAKLDFLKLLKGKRDEGETRKVKAVITPEVLFETVFRCVDQAKKEYSKEIKLSNEDFAKMLVMDGCFIIGFSEGLIHTKIIGSTEQQIENFNALILRDLMLLENQIPFSVVRQLHRCIYGDYNPNFVCRIPWGGLMRIDLRNDQRSPSNPAQTPNGEIVFHLLHLLHQMHPIPEPPKASSSANGKPWDVQMIPSATQLIDCRLKVRRKIFPVNSQEENILEVSFSRGELDIPRFRVDATTYHSLRNLIAFEQHSNQIEPKFTSYCMLLDNLINTAKDVANLQDRGIIQNLLGDDSEVAQVFNGLCKNVYLDFNRHSYGELYKEVAVWRSPPLERRAWANVRNIVKNPVPLGHIAIGFLILLISIRDKTNEVALYFCAFSWIIVTSFIAGLVAFSWANY